jgi:nucleotide-binding universal stress UspA family protein
MAFAASSCMGHIQTILVPIDGSRPSVDALAYAVAFAEDAGANIDVLYVKAPDAFEIGTSTPSTPAALEAAEHEREAALRAASERLGDRLSQRTEAGDPLRKILEVAEEGDYDLVVMGTHGRVGRLHMLLGSVAEGVVRNAPCPVLTARAAGGEDESFAERLHRTRSLGEQTSSR